MFLTRRNKIAGRPLAHFPYEEDPDTGYGGYRWGYCSGCNHTLYLRKTEMEEVVSRFYNVLGYEIPKESFKNRVTRYLIKKLA
jgi:hypothetical protein